MSNVVDARGLSCPQPVIMTVDEIKKMEQGEITVLVDTDTAKENVSRAAKSKGWSVLEINPDEEGYKIRIGK
ncbi:MAG: sulfurtransferase TusA family protein [Firmicutes bacterium]|nr:sulfurtransferase TusA family protein [Bacillota bacterium]